MSDPFDTGNLLDVYQAGANPDNLGRGPALMSVIWTLTAISIIVIGAHLLNRKYSDALHWDDAFMFAALVMQIVNSGFLTEAFSWGLGKHDRDLTLRQLINGTKWAWLGQTPGAFAAVLARISAAIFLFRLFGIKTWFRYYLIIFTSLQVAVLVALLLVMWIGTRPIEATWNPLVEPTREVDFHIVLDLAYLGQALLTFADITYVVFPVIFIWRLNMTLVKRVALIMLIGTSLITAGASIAKATKMVVSDNVGEASYESTLAAIFSNTEQNLVIIIGSLPALRNVSRSNDGPFSRVKSFFSSYVDSRKGTSSSSDGLRKDTETSDSGSGSDTNLQRNSRNHRPQGSSSNFRRPIDAPYKSGDSAQHPMEKHVDIAIP